MGRKIICESCGTIFKEELLGNLQVCPVCGESLSDASEEELITWCYYGYFDEKGNKMEGGSLTDKQIDFEKYEDIYLIKEFKAPPRDADGKCEAAKAELRKYIPDAFPEKKAPFLGIRCPRCGSTEIQLVAKRFSILTGIATNQYDRMCVYCKKKF